MNLLCNCDYMILSPATFIKMGKRINSSVLSPYLLHIQTMAYMHTHTYYTHSRSCSGSGSNNDDDDDNSNNNNDKTSHHPVITRGHLMWLSYSLYPRDFIELVIGQETKTKQIFYYRHSAVVLAVAFQPASDEPQIPCADQAPGRTDTYWRTHVKLIPPSPRLSLSCREAINFLMLCIRSLSMGMLKLKWSGSRLHFLYKVPRITNIAIFSSDEILALHRPASDIRAETAWVKWRCVPNTKALPAAAAGKEVPFWRWSKVYTEARGRTTASGNVVLIPPGLHQPLETSRSNSPCPCCLHDPRHGEQG